MRSYYQIHYIEITDNSGTKDSGEYQGIKTPHLSSNILNAVILFYVVNDNSSSWQYNIL